MDSVEGVARVTWLLSFYNLLSSPKYNVHSNREAAVRTFKGSIESFFLRSRGFIDFVGSVNILVEAILILENSEAKSLASELSVLCLSYVHCVFQRVRTEEAAADF